MKTTVKERLKDFIKSKGIGQAAFEKAVGLSNGYVNNIRQSIQPDTLLRISQCYPELNINWLMTGEGVMSRIVDRMEIYVLSKGQSVEEVGKLIWANSFLEEMVRGKKKKDTFFKYYRENPNDDVSLRGMNYFISKYAFDVNPIWLLTGQGAMLKTEDEKKCKSCEELTKRIGVLEYQLAKLRKKK
jgi:transcriptional regulator with XRE-family HTH domain